MSQPFRTDSLRPSSLPSATLGRRRHYEPRASALDAPDGSENLTLEERAQVKLDKEHDRWNERIDKDVEACVDGLKELVQLADISNTQPNSLTATTLPLHLPVKTSSLIRSALNVRDMAHELKLLLLLSDDIGLVEARDKEKALLREEISAGRKGVLEAAMEGLGKGQTEEGAKGQENEMEVEQGDAEAQVDGEKGSSTGEPSERLPIEDAAAGEEGSESGSDEFEQV
ncbi:hypothetical protein L198_01047 [Cryptococcus wingfieldii CBS 7118]|uniref:Uncharacterized protein n=1 Tax=Cryptococcus wingfieldii CBS 7118 TaxID=1295528 RepID=A0A1E3K2R3_9TREE|nr:hypothetical protein L198_01047 [Cryptococcus wingfieldii CBS 7118]ODO07468.1 hypothetical protein L198_01047 [Cryptococcus wingfieldii CBS 7118]